MTDDRPLRIPHRGELAASVIVLHGYGARGAVHEGDGRAFAGDGVEVLLPDAPHHGGRDDGRLAQLAELDAAERRAAILEIARAWCSELPALAADCRARGARRVALVGISMGGFAALGALSAPGAPGSATAAGAFAAIAALLAGPELVADDDVPADHPPLLLGLAGRDAAVPPEPGRAFAARHGADSEHLMRAPDWHDLWAHTAAFVRRHVDDAG